MAEFALWKQRKFAVSNFQIDTKQ